MVYILNVHAQYDKADIYGYDDDLKTVLLEDLIIKLEDVFIENS